MRAAKYQHNAATARLEVKRAENLASEAVEDMKLVLDEERGKLHATLRSEREKTTVRDRMLDQTVQRLEELRLRSARALVR